MENERECAEVFRSGRDVDCVCEPRPRRCRYCCSFIDHLPRIPVHRSQHCPHTRGRVSSETTHDRVTQQGDTAWPRYRYVVAVYASDRRGSNVTAIRVVVHVRCVDPLVGTVRRRRHPIERLPCCVRHTVRGARRRRRFHIVRFRAQARVRRVHRIRGARWIRGYDRTRCREVYRRVGCRNTTGCQHRCAVKRVRPPSGSGGHVDPRRGSDAAGARPLHEVRPKRRRRTVCEHPRVRRYARKKASYIACRQPRRSCGLRAQKVRGSRRARPPHDKSRGVHPQAADAALSQAYRRSESRELCQRRMRSYRRCDGPRDR